MRGGITGGGDVMRVLSGFMTEEVIFAMRGHYATSCSLKFQFLIFGPDYFPSAPSTFSGIGHTTYKTGPISSDNPRLI